MFVVTNKCNISRGNKDKHTLTTKQKSSYFILYNYKYGINIYLLISICNFHSVISFVQMYKYMGMILKIKCK